jgi:hypothetical protein
MGFQYDSNLPFYWEPVRSMGDLTPEQADGLRRGLRFYDPVKYPQDRSLPRYSNGIIEIPVSLPDDEILLDRMGLPVARIGDVWTEMAERALERRELLCLQLHPERILHLEPALRRVLDFVADSSLFWFATMKEIASWWSERVGAALEVVPEGNGAYRVAACGARRLGLAVVEPLSGIRRDIVVGDSIPSRAGPVIGLGEKASSRLRNDIRQLGYFYEITSDSNAVNLYIDREIQGPDLEAVIARCPSPLVVDTFWPAPFSAALAVTGDIDCLTLGDFLRRFWED